MEKSLIINILDYKCITEDINHKKNEMESLVKTYGLFEISENWIKKTEIDLRNFLRKGTLDDAMFFCKKEKISYLILGNILKPRQIWELTEIFRKINVQVWDRVDLILNIFSQHAHSSEAKLQIKLAKIKHMGPRIFGMGDELSRQGGGGFTTRGIGETNTEIMKRHLRREELKIEEKLKKVQKTKCLHRQNRKRSHQETVALIGYTNAGKSQLMNSLSKKGVSVKDALFQTLDTKIGTIFLTKSYREIFISDTIGFIADLPPKLIAAFSSTLSESINADLLLHIVDVSDPKHKEKIKIVDDILSQLNIAEKPQILVFNKIDKAKKRFGKIKLKQEYKDRNPVFISAKEKINLNELKNQIEKTLPKNTSFDTKSC